jgi:L-Ala-D/L-Glu epimerase
MNRVKDIHLREIARPLRVTFATSLGRKETMRSLIVRVSLGDGSVGLGECPTSAAFGKETIPVVRSLLASWAQGARGMDIEDWAEKSALLRRAHRGFPMAVSGFETALFRAFLGSRGFKEHSYWGGRLSSLETDITIPFIPGHGALEGWLDYAARKGFKVFKVKVSGNPEEDRRFLSGLYEDIGRRVPDFTVRLDGNQGYTASTFLRMTEYLEKAGHRIEFFEQPLPKDDFSGLRAVKRRSPVPIILDETVVTREDLERAADRDLCHGVNIKIAKSGIQESSAIMKRAGDWGLKLMIGCMTETMVGLTAGIYMAAGSGSFDYIDLDGIYFLHHRKRYGMVEVRGPGFLIG